jgi:hypothetical protein
MIKEARELHRTVSFQIKRWKIRNRIVSFQIKGNQIGIGLSDGLISKLSIL